MKLNFLRTTHAYVHWMYLCLCWHMSIDPENVNNGKAHQISDFALTKQSMTLKHCSSMYWAPNDTDFFGRDLLVNSVQIG